MDEIWKAIPDYEGLYDASNLGRVRSLNYNHTGQVRILKQMKNKSGYMHVTLHKNGKQKRVQVHRVIYEAFNGKIPEGMVIDHINTIRNDCRLENLRCVTPKENSNNPLTLKRSRYAISELSKDKVFETKRINALRKKHGTPVLQINSETGEIIRKWECITDASKLLGINHQNIYAVCKGNRGRIQAGGFIWRFA